MSQAPSRPSILKDDDVTALRAAAIRFGPGTDDAKLAALAACAARAPGNVRTLVAYHDTLLFLEAYPSSQALLDGARREMSRVAKHALRIAAEGSEAQRRWLDRSGIAGGEVTACFSHEIACWLATRHRGRAEITSFGGAPLADVLALCLPAIESELVASGGDSLALLDEAKGERGTRLAWLVHALARLPGTSATRAHLFDALKPFLTIRAGNCALSRTRARAPVPEVWFHREPLERQPRDPAAAIGAPLPPLRPLREGEQQHLVDTARAALAMLSRETDPVTWPSANAVCCYELGRGASLVLYPMHPARRFALDSHTGYMIFRNGVPLGYGGGWPFLAACRIGTNIFAPFRGGDSSWLFAQVLSVYRSHFAVKRFVVEPYQFGAGNREGLLSGAFWFYYRLGFRPVDRSCATLARKEFSRMADRGYRPPLATMRALTASDLALDMAASAADERCEPAQLSLAVSQWIARAHHGDRGAATKDAVRRVSAALDVADLDRWRRTQRASFESLALLFGLIDDLGQWSPRERALCVEIIRAKAADDDADYFRRLAAHRRLAGALARIAARVD